MITKKIIRLENKLEKVEDKIKKINKHIKEVERILKLNYRRLNKWKQNQDMK